MKFLAETHFEVEKKRTKLTQFFFEQWNYIETYKVFRTSYLMVNFLRTLQYLDKSQKQRLLEKLDSFVPSDLIVNYPFLKKLKASIRAEIQKTFPENFVKDNLETKAGQIGLLTICL